MRPARWSGYCVRYKYTNYILYSRYPWHASCQVEWTIISPVLDTSILIIYYIPGIHGMRSARWSGPLLVLC